MTKKTISVNEVIDRANKMLSESLGDSASREGIMMLTENILHATGNYRGFRYLIKNEVPDGRKPGINVDINGEYYSNYDQRFEDTDSTRIAYLQR